MSTTLVDVYRDIEEVDPIHDLEHRSIHLNAEGVSWLHAPTLDDFTRAQLLQFYYHMALTRAVDLEIVKLSRKGLAFGKHLMCTGNEATAVGAAAAAQRTDWLTLAIRDLGAYVVRDVPVFKLLAQACGRANGLTRGWDGSLHMGSLPHRIIGLISHLGTLVSIGTGCAFAEKYSGTKTAVLSFSGEGATSTGDFHEALNIASVLRLPIVIIIENNQWAFGTPTCLQYAVPTPAVRALAYGRLVDGYWIDGTNVLTVFDIVQRALERARHEKVISIIDAVSLRFEGHSLADPFKTYVPQEQLAAWKKKDPIAVFRVRLLEHSAIGESDLLEVDNRVAADIREASLIAEQDSPAVDGDLTSKVFVSSALQLSDFDAADANPGKLNITYREAIHDALVEAMDQDPNLFMIGEDIGLSNGAFKVTEGFCRRYDHIDWPNCWRSPEPLMQRRIVDAPLSEAGFCGLALGAVQAGLRAIVEFQYADFSSEAFKMIVNYAATQVARGMGPLPIVFRMPAGWAANSSMYHSVNPESWFASTPGLKIVAPITAYDAKGLLLAALRDNNPVLYLEYKAFYRIRPETLPSQLALPVPQVGYIVPIGKARVVSEGTDISIVTYGSQVVRALEAAEQLNHEDGVSVELIDLRTIAPYDREAVRRSVRKTSRLLVTCEAPRTGCFGNTVVADIMSGDFEYLDAPVSLVAAADTPVPFAPALEGVHLPTVEKLVAAARYLLAY
jgi:2-oxoisovalerate dehydrogenase E1 component